MRDNQCKTLVEKLLQAADIKINGQRPWDIQVLNENFYKRVLSSGSLGLGESFMDGWWECERLDEFIHKALKADVRSRISINLTTAKTYLLSRLFNLQGFKRAKEVAIRHYDLSNQLYQSFLDPYMQYSCGYFKDAINLNVAQEQKLKFICEKLQLKPSDKVLDIGCGWGGFAKYAAGHYGCLVTGITISKEQANFAREFTKSLPVSIKEMDYRELNGKFDKILNCGMMEHVGPKNHKTIFKIMHGCLSDNGLLLLHTIGDKTPKPVADPWIHKYIFPNGVLPSLSQLTAASEKLFIVEDLQNFGAYYDPTLMAWFKNFDSHWGNLRKNFDDRFYRMWKFYLLSCAGLFRARHTQLWQFVYSKKGVEGGYESIR